MIDYHQLVYQLSISWSICYLFFIFSFQQGENTIKKFNPKNKHITTLLIKWNVEFLTLTSYREKIDNAKIEKKT
jgi:hypothetical protein